jgi:hypothetical protein
MADHDADLDPRLLLAFELLAVLAAAAFLAYYVYPLLGIVVVGAYAIVMRQIIIARQEKRAAEAKAVAQGKSRYTAPPTTTPAEPGTAAAPTPHVYRASENQRE